MDMFDGIIVGAAAAAIGSVIAYKILNKAPVGGDTPGQAAVGGIPQFGRPQPLYVVDLVPTPSNAAPVQQTNPITEAAYNVQPVAFESAFGNTANTPSTEYILPY